MVLGTLRRGPILVYRLQPRHGVERGTQAVGGRLLMRPLNSPVLPPTSPAYPSAWLTMVALVMPKRWSAS